MTAEARDLYWVSYTEVIKIYLPTPVEASANISDMFALPLHAVVENDLIEKEYPCSYVPFYCVISSTSSSDDGEGGMGVRFASLLHPFDTKTGSCSMIRSLRLKVGRHLLTWSPKRRTRYLQKETKVQSQYSKTRVPSSKPKTMPVISNTKRPPPSPCVHRSR